MPSPTLSPTLSPAPAKTQQAEPQQAEAKQALARHALEHYLRPNMTLGLGSGTTAEAFIQALAKDKAKRPRLCIASSKASHQLAESLNLPVLSPQAFFIQTLSEKTKDSPPPPLAPPLASPLDLPLDLTIDGADAIDPSLRLVKGGGGCLLHEKILAQNSRSMLVLAEERKLARRLGAFPLPVEIDPFAWQLTARAVSALFERTLERSGNLTLRGGKASPSLSDGGHYTLDCDWGEWNDDSASLLASSLNEIAGVLEHGLFVFEASLCLLARPQKNQKESQSNAGKISIREMLRPTLKP